MTLLEVKDILDLLYHIILMYQRTKDTIDKLNLLEMVHPEVTKIPYYIDFKNMDLNRSV
jgi:hypothetical protein